MMGRIVIPGVSMSNSTKVMPSCRLPVVAVRTSTTFKGDDWIGLRMRDVSVVRGIGVLPIFAGLLGLLLLVGSLAVTWAREGR